VRLPALLYRVYEKRLARSLVGADLPHHVGVMLDGNRRWARENGFSDPNEGHRAGAAHIDQLLGWCTESGIRVVTLWLLSTDNLRRPLGELEPLLEIITDVVDELAAPGQHWKLRMVGALDRLPSEMRDRLSAAEERTADRDGAEVNIAVGYGGRQEIIDAVKSLLRDHVAQGQTLEEVIDGLNVEAIGEHLYTSGQRDPDLVIRTSGEQRIGGFMMWQSVHTEFWFCDAYWPDFRRVDFLRALRDYAARHRRFGG
jgi:short-chain Z-isoprenyl diphosphate synthase